MTPRFGARVVQKRQSCHLLRWGSRLQGGNQKFYYGLVKFKMPVKHPHDKWEYEVLGKINGGDLSLGLESIQMLSKPMKLNVITDCRQSS